MQNDGDLEALLNANISTRWYFYNNGSQEYISPHTQIYYAETSFHIFREKEEFKKWNDREDRNKFAFFTFKCTKEYKVGKLLNELNSLINLSNFRILETTNNHVKFCILL